MKNSFQESWDDRQAERDALDRALDAALAKYAAVEPRPGLEPHILAQLQSERRTIPIHSWWQWGAAGAIAAIFIIVASLAWKSSKPAKSLVQQHPSAPIELVAPSTTLAVNSGSVTARSLRTRPGRMKARRGNSSALVADKPKLDQFPSPRPLSEQEKLALEYVEKSPEEAALVARAQEAALIAEAQSDSARMQQMENRDVESNPR
jgi:hypothetical protein